MIKNAFDFSDEYKKELRAKALFYLSDGENFRTTSQKYANDIESQKLKKELLLYLPTFEPDLGKRVRDKFDLQNRVTIDEDKILKIAHECLAGTALKTLAKKYDMHSSILQRNIFTYLIKNDFALAKELRAELDSRVKSTVIPSRKEIIGAVKEYLEMGYQDRKFRGRVADSIVSSYIYCRLAFIDYDLYEKAMAKRLRTSKPTEQEKIELEGLAKEFLEFDGSGIKFAEQKGLDPEKTRIRFENRLTLVNRTLAEQVKNKYHGLYAFAKKLTDEELLAAAREYLQDGKSFATVANEYRTDKKAIGDDFLKRLPALDLELSAKVAYKKALQRTR
ncbi:hypothetical protein [Treponema sp. R6D11]